jgi:hypothetical protein
LVVIYVIRLLSEILNKKLVIVIKGDLYFNQKGNKDH